MRPKEVNGRRGSADDRLMTYLAVGSFNGIRDK